MAEAIGSMKGGTLLLDAFKYSFWLRNQPKLFVMGSCTWNPPTGKQGLLRPVQSFSNSCVSFKPGMVQKDTECDQSELR
jgi:hypothetical protein